ncbi:MAG: DNA primase [Actinomycetia bacterium]|nr:DNA primase [Actinomycetes bacterium]
MAGRIRDEDIALVRERARIDEVVGEYVQLRSAGGGSLKGLCPFHEERSPSFNVTPARGYFFCFGCSEGGDVITFVQKIDHLTFAEAVERLAAKYGVQLRYEEGGSAPGRQHGQRTRLVEAHRAAQVFYAEQLATAAEAEAGRQFLTGRGFDREAAVHFGVGYAPKGWDALTRHLRGKGFTDTELATGGLVSEGTRGVYDRFRGRLVWPIHDITGDVIGFGARRLYDDDQGPKYLNTPESPIYKKSQVLFGIDLAKKEIARRQQAVVVEGYTDVMACHLAGVGTAVATCGTSFGEEHVKILRRLLMDQDEFRGEVVFTFDGDAAGQKAALRAFTEDQKFVTQTFVAVEPGGMDPCELWQAKGAEAVRDLVARRVPLSEFVIRSTLARYDLSVPEGRVAALRAAAPIVARTKDRSLRPEYARSLAGWLGMDVEPVLAAVGQALRGSRPAEVGAAGAAPGRPETAGRPRPDDRELMVDREALKTALQQPGLTGAEFDALAPEDFTHPAYVAVARAVSAAGGVTAAGAGGEGWVTRVRDAAGNDAVRSVVTELAVEPLRCDGEPDSRYAAEQVARIQERQVTRRVVELKSRLQRLDPDAGEEYSRVFGELIALEQQRRLLRDRATGEQ